MYYASRRAFVAFDHPGRIEYWKFESKQECDNVVSAKPGMYRCKKPTGDVKIHTFSHAEPCFSTIRLIAK